ncbi:MAG: septation protein SepH [Beutenbergiaceae bacterium]
MAELELVGIHADGEHIVLVDEEGQRHRVAIDDALRAAVRRDRPNLEQLRSGALRPREIQARIRAGATAEDVAADSGMPLEQVRRYQGPALAEREHVAARAQQLSIGRENGAPMLGDLVVDRLAARGVDQVQWDARRSGSDPWEAVAIFVEGDRERQASWRVDLAAGTLHALDDESRGLSETDLDAGGGRRHLSAVRPARLYDVETDADLAPAPVDAIIRDRRPSALHALPAGEAEPDDSAVPASATVAAPDPIMDMPAEPSAVIEQDTQSLLDELSAARGVRQRIEIDDEALAQDVASETPLLWDEAPEPEVSAPPAREGRRGSKNGRTSVPSWDEIVFGARTD